MKTILLIGFRGTGKTALGDALAKRLSIRFRDSDAEIVAELYGETLESFVRTEGEMEFRRRERAAIDRILRDCESGTERTIVALGGGFVDFEATVARLRGFLSVNKAETRVIWLQSSIDVVAERLRGDSKNPRVRAMTDPEALLDLYKFREPEYKKLADLIFENAFENVELATVALSHLVQKD